MADIFVQRGTNSIAAAGGTDTSFTSVSSLNNAFEFNNNSRLTNGGPTTNGGNMEADDLSGIIELTATSTLTLSRVAGSSSFSMEFYWELIEYVGAASGANEFIIRSRNTITMASVSSGSQALDNNPTDSDKCIPFIVGVTNSSTSNNGDELCVVANINGNNVEVRRGATAGTTVVQVVTVEFTGSNWSVYHGTSTSSADTGTITLNTNASGSGGSAGDVGNWGSAFIFGSITSADHGLDSLGSLHTPNAATTSVDWTLNGGNNSSHEHFVHVLQHDDMVVTRYQNTANTAGTTSIDITSAGLTDISEAMIIGRTISSGGGTAYGRGWRNFRLTSTTTAEHWAHRSGNTLSHDIQVIDFSGVTSAGGAFTLTADAGVYSLTGSDAAVTAGRETSAVAGSVTVTGSDVTFSIRTDYSLSSDNGTYLVDGRTASLLSGRSLPADNASYSTTGAGASLISSRQVVTEAGAHVVTGSDANLIKTSIDPVLSAESASYSVSGSSAVLTYTSNVPVVTSFYGGGGGGGSGRAERDYLKKYKKVNRRREREEQERIAIEEIEKAFERAFREIFHEANQKVQKTNSVFRRVKSEAVNAVLESSRFSVSKFADGRDQYYKQLKKIVDDQAGKFELKRKIAEHVKLQEAFNKQAIEDARNDLAIEEAKKDIIDEKNIREAKLDIEIENKYNKEVSEAKEDLEVEKAKNDIKKEDDKMKKKKDEVIIFLLSS